MRSRILKLTRLVAVIALAAVPAVPGTPTMTPANSPALAKAPYEVRLRKLHLVRPDLIPYPVFFEAYC